MRTGLDVTGIAPVEQDRTAALEPADILAVIQLKSWTRQRFGLTADDPVMVRQEATTEPGFPPLKTIVTFWTASDRPHQFTLFKPVRSAAQGDVPPAWLKDALRLLPMEGCSCC